MGVPLVCGIRKFLVRKSLVKKDASNVASIVVVIAAMDFGSATRFGSTA